MINQIFPLCQVRMNRLRVARALRAHPLFNIDDWVGGSIVIVGVKLCHAL